MKGSKNAGRILMGKCVWVLCRGYQYGSQKVVEWVTGCKKRWVLSRDIKPGGECQDCHKQIEVKNES